MYRFNEDAFDQDQYDAVLGQDYDADDLETALNADDDLDRLKAAFEWKRQFNADYIINNLGIGPIEAQQYLGELEDDGYIEMIEIDI